jgi:hypothetical protein
MSSLTRYLQKAYWKITTYRPSPWTIAFVVLAIAIFLLGGGIYDLLEQSSIPIAIFSSSGGAGSFIFLYPYPSLNDQFIAESILIMMLYSMGIIGLLVTYQSTKYAYKPRQAYIMLLGGLFFMLIAYALLEYIFFIRTGQF